METKTQAESRSYRSTARVVGAPAASQSVAAGCLGREPSVRNGEAYTIIVVDHDRTIREEMQNLLEANGYAVQLFEDCSAFLDSHRTNGRGCLLVDELMLRMSGVKLIERLKSESHAFPTIVMSSKATLPKAVQAMRAGAFDFVEKPIDMKALLASVKWAIELADVAPGPAEFQEMAAKRIADLTPRQHQILDLVLAGHPSKNIAADLGISQRTVENHRAEITRRCGSKNLSGMFHVAICGTSGRLSQFLPRRSKLSKWDLDPQTNDWWELLRAV